MYTLRTKVFQGNEKGKWVRVFAFDRYAPLPPSLESLGRFYLDNHTTLLKASRHLRDNPNRLGCFSLRLKFVWFSKRVCQQKEQNRSQHQREHRSMYWRVTKLRDCQDPIRMRQPVSHDDGHVTFTSDQLADMLKIWQKKTCQIFCSDRKQNCSSLISGNTVLHRAALSNPQCAISACNVYVSLTKRNVY